MYEKRVIPFMDPLPDELMERDRKYVKAILEHGPRKIDISNALGMKMSSLDSWLMDGTNRWPVYEDNARLYIDTNAMRPVE